MTYDIVGRSGHMDKKGQYVEDQVVIRLVDGDDTAIGRAPSEKDALVAAQDAIERFRSEQELLSHPEVASAREALSETMQRIRRGDD